MAFERIKWLLDKRKLALEKAGGRYPEGPGRLYLRRVLTPFRAPERRLLKEGALAWGAGTQALVPTPPLSLSSLKELGFIWLESPVLRISGLWPLKWTRAGVPGGD